jgi:hypothetical protein
MALRIKDHSTATSLVTVKTVHSLGANWLRKDKRTPNYPSFGLLNAYKLGDYGDGTFTQCHLVVQRQTYAKLSISWIALRLRAWRLTRLPTTST